MSIERISPDMPRPDVLIGSTYKIKPLGFENAYYITINDCILNAGTDYESRQSFECFINTKENSQFQWVSALTVAMSSTLRTGSNVKYLLNAWKEICDPKGEVREKGGKAWPSLVSRIASVIEDHIDRIGAL
jgi:hypothetical protein